MKKQLSLNSEPDNFTKHIREIITFHKAYGKNNEIYCITCGRELDVMEHNYGTDDYPQCIQCANL